MSGERARDIRDPIRLWRWLRVFALLYLILELGALALYGVVHYGGNFVDANDAAKSALFWGTAIYSLGVPLIYLACVVLTCLITYRTMKNLHALNSAQVEMSPGWAVGYYFVPFANLIMPVQGVGQIWRGTFWHEENPSAPNGLIALWWTALMLALVAQLIAGSGLMDSGEYRVALNFDSSNPQQMSLAGVSAVALSALATVLFLNVFGRIAHGQSKMIKTAEF